MGVNLSVVAPALAKPRRRVNHCDVSATSGTNVADEPRKPIRTPCAAMNVQRLGAEPAAMNPVPTPTVPISTGTITP